MAKFRCIRTCITHKKYYERGQFENFDECPNKHWVPANAPDVPIKTPRLGTKMGGASPKGKPMRAPNQKDLDIQAAEEAKANE